MEKICSFTDVFWLQQIAAQKRCRILENHVGFDKIGIREAKALLFCFDVYEQNRKQLQTQFLASQAAVSRLSPSKCRVSRS